MLVGVMTAGTDLAETRVGPPVPMQCRGSRRYLISVDPFDDDDGKHKVMSARCAVRLAGASMKTKLMQRSKCNANKCRWCPNQSDLLSRRSAGLNRRSSQRDFVAMPKACRRGLR